MKLLKIMIIAIIFGVANHISAQVDVSKIEQLKTGLKQSLYCSEVSIDKKNVVYRIDNNGNSFRYNLNDIKEVKYVFDSFPLMIIEFKEGKTATTKVDGGESEQKLNVFAFRDQAVCESAIKSLKEIIETILDSEE